MCRCILSTRVAPQDKLNCDFVVHGDDMPTSADGSNVYDEVRAAVVLVVVAGCGLC